jgi:hypothetical protein
LSTARRVSVAIVVLAASLALPSTTCGQTLESALKLIGGAAVGLGLHESAHVVADVASGVAPGLKKVSFGPIPFFAITHNAVPPGREFVISSAGFWMQHSVNEYVFAKHPGLRDEHAPVLKGILAFNILTSIAYSGAAFARTGPAERDTRGIALSAGVDEPVIGAVILVPAILDTARYFGKDSHWIVWGSRAVKIGGALLAVKAIRRD